MEPSALSKDTKKLVIRKTWLCEDVDEVPFLIEIGPFHGATTKYYDDDAQELAWNVEFHRRREGVYDYGMPNIKPNRGISIVASAFGCETTVNNEADPWIKPLLREENREAAFELDLPDTTNNPAFKRAYERTAYFQRNSTMPLRLINVPSPLVTASLIWDYTSFMEATILYPKEVHALLEKVTVATIGYVQHQLSVIDNLFTMGHEMWYLPRDLGVRISDDTAALMSPDLYREFGVRYNNMVSRAFGGIVVHSCGDVHNVVDVMTETEGLIGLDLTIPQNHNWEKIRNSVKDKVALNLRHYYWDHGDDGRTDLVDYSKKLVDYFGRRGVFIQTSVPDAAQAVTLGRKLHELLSR